MNVIPHLAPKAHDSFANRRLIVANAVSMDALQAS
jgi:hypothetical protein